jgi:hypothetical protein
MMRLFNMLLAMDVRILQFALFLKASSSFGR